MGPVWRHHHTTTSHHMARHHHQRRHSICSPTSPHTGTTLGWFACYTTTPPHTTRPPPHIHSARRISLVNPAKCGEAAARQGPRGLAACQLPHRQAQHSITPL
ncbi:hypothetical protein E2C01_086780 [Portunus trituberculatus]|uniref:Uncharacterized protein n=1 Tax=Portunus trituberculatus TaxID=210409 RepID=A0A5B7JHA3_PORTR|nr:hypothetical protein [Portunus trituberculatus]